jgi:competence protein ComEC
MQTISQHQIIFFSLRKNYAAAFLKGRTAFLITDLKNDDKNYQFYVKPALDQAQILNVNFLSLDRDIVTREIIIQNHQVVFQGYKMLFIDERLNYKKLHIEGTFSALWLHQNTRFNLNKLPSQLKFKSIIIDATNKDYQIEKFKAFAENIQLKAHILKKNKAYLVQLTP